jgi:hypothetical protein
MRVFRKRVGIERALRVDKSLYRGIGHTYYRLMHSHRNKGQFLRGIMSSHHRVIPFYYRKGPSLSLKISFLYSKMTFYSADGSTFCGEWSFFSREETFFCRVESVHRRIIHVHRHAKRVHSVIAHSSRGIGHTQCRKESSPEQSGSCYPRIGSIIHRKLCVNCLIEPTLCGKRKAKSRITRALRPWEERS